MREHSKPRPGAKTGSVSGKPEHFDRMSGSGAGKWMLSRGKSMCDLEMPMLDFPMSMLANEMDRAFME
jgi:hypothetical protein